MSHDLPAHPDPATDPAADPATEPRGLGLSTFATVMMCLGATMVTLAAWMDLPANLPTGYLLARAAMTLAAAVVMAMLIRSLLRLRHHPTDPLAAPLHQVWVSATTLAIVIVLSLDHILEAAAAGNPWSTSRIAGIPFHIAVIVPVTLGLLIHLFNLRTARRRQPTLMSHP